MDKARKKNIKRIAALVCAVAVVLLLAAMPLLTRSAGDTDGPRASILSGTAETGSISTEVIGGGTLAEEDAVSVSVPSAVKLTEFLVSNGDTVREGDAIASVDRVTVMTAIAEVQETLDYLAEAIEAASEADTDGEVTALAGGTVKIVYGEEGASVQDVMLAHGALAVLSLDGLMAVDLEIESDLKSGTAVTVTLSDETAVTGEIASNLLGEMTVTVQDDDYAVGEEVQVSAEDGTNLGSGSLYIYNPWNATAYAGTIDSIKVSAGDRADAGDTLMELSNMGYSAAYRQLLSQRQEYEERMLELFEMYQTETVTAPCDGVVSGIDADSVQLLAAGNPGYTVTLLSNSPNGDDETLYANYVGQVNAVGQNGWAVSINPQSVPIGDYLDLSGISLDTALMTEVVLYTQTSLPVYTLADGEWVQVDASEIGTGDILLFAADGDGSFIWVVLVQKAEQPDDSGNGTQPTIPGDSAQPSVPDDAGSDQTTLVSPDSSVGDWSSIGRYPQTGGMAEEPAYELYGLDIAEIASVTPQDTITLEITVDELDISSLQTGMPAEIKVGALSGEKYPAVITEISNTGTSGIGNSKFTVELTLDRGENMLAGMNATASIVLNTTKDAVTVPVDALVDDGTKTVVYTGYDEENEVLIDPVTVTVGVSDGQAAEILDGLSVGSTYYYAYYDTLEISYTPDFGRGGFSFFG